MELYTALRQLTEQWGNEIVTEQRVLSMLSRKRCFTYRPELKKLYQSLINVGYTQRILDLEDNDSWQEELEGLSDTFYYRLDYDLDDVYYVFYSVAYGIGLFENEDHFIDIDDEEEMDGEDANDDDGNYGFYDDQEDADFEDIDTDNYSISQQYHEKKDVNIYVVRPKERLDSSSFDDCRRKAKQYGNGYYSSFRGVNGFVFNIPGDAIAFAEEVIGKKTIADVEDNLNYEITNKRLSKPQNQKFDKPLLNMKLHIALKSVIDTDGVDIINEVRLVNILDDLKAFESIPASKYILRAIITDGYARKLYTIGSWNANAQKLIQQFSNTTGFQPDYVYRIFQSIAFALNFISEIDNVNSSNIIQSVTARNTTSQKLNLTSSKLSKKSESFKHDYKKDAENYLDNITEIKGDFHREFGADFTFSTEYNLTINSFLINVEISGKISYKFADQYSDSIIINAIIYDSNGRVITKKNTYIEKCKFKLPFQMLTISEFYDKDYRTIDNVSKILIYWEEL